MAEALKLPNRTHLDSPVGDESCNLEVARWGTPRSAQIDHLEIASKFDLLDFHNAAKLTGSKFVFLKNEAALLELGLLNYAMQKAF